ncbi:MT-A70 family methyltransferase [Rubripirellula reticaptiva]|nr:MT-A70 family methyltransferase [Rubripirellula reticaptiva]
MGLFTKEESSDQSQSEPKQEGREVAATNDHNDAASAQLIALNGVQQALAVVSRVEDIKEIRDRAEAVRKYIESVGLGLEVQNKAAELKLRAERKAGEMLAEMKLHGGDRRSDQSADRRTLEDLGISKDQSSRWQLLAAVPENLFDDFIGQFTVRRVELTTAEALRYARTIRGPGKGGKSATENDWLPPAMLSEVLASGAKFGCIYAAPPATGDGEGTLSIDQLCGLPIGDLAAENAHLHLWTCNEQCAAAHRVVEAWGFKPQDILVWIRPKRGPGPYWRRAHELLMLGVRGDCPFQDKTVHSWIKANKPRNGGKPSAVRDLVEAVSPGPYVELFANKTARGWQCCQVDDES